MLLIEPSNDLRCAAVCKQPQIHICLRLQTIVRSESNVNGFYTEVMRFLWVRLTTYRKVRVHKVQIWQLEEFANSSVNTRIERG